MQGLFMLPDAEATAPENPGVDRAAIGEGLLAYATVCEPNVKTRRQRFRRMVERIRRLWDIESKIYFIQLAHEFEWVQKGHGWAVAALPELFVEYFGEVGTEKEHCWLVWHWFVKALEPWGVVKPIAKDSELCGGHIRLVRFSVAHSALCQSVREKFENLALGKAEMSEAEACHCLEQQIALVAQFAKNQHQQNVADLLLATRELFLAEKNLTSGLPLV